MQALAIVIVLIASLLMVQRSVRFRPLSALRPLDVDKGLPLPEIGQASTIFSLTALFGAYLGIYLTLGIPAVVGLACGSVAGLFIIRGWILSRPAHSFEQFVESMLAGDKDNGDVFASMVFVAQCIFATSELLILKDASRIALGMRGDYALLFAVSTGVIGYFYVLFGAYLAVYRTDIIQFMLIALMVVAAGAYLWSSNSMVWNASVWPRAGYWVIPIVKPVPPIMLYIYQFLIGAIMGFGLFGAAPDAWKRVFVVTKLRRKTKRRFTFFVGIGVAPFIVLVLFGGSLRRIPDGIITMQHAFPNSPSHDIMFIGAALGLIACFLSSFNSALLAAVHIGLLQQRLSTPIEKELPRFHWIMALALLSIFFVFSILSGFHNPYLLGNALLGIYATIAGIQFGTGARPASLPRWSVSWIGIVAIAGWLMYFILVQGLPDLPTTYEVNTVPAGALLFIIVASTCRLLRKAGVHHA